MNTIELRNALNAAADYFAQTGNFEWEGEARESLNKMENNDLSFVENLWLKYAPTCDIDDLLITDYKPEDEPKVNELNEKLAEIANSTFAALDKVKSENT